MQYVLSHQKDIFGGFTIDVKGFPDSTERFEQGLLGLINLAKQENGKLIWLTLPRMDAHLVPVLVRHGFVFHTCSDDQLTMIYRLESNAFAPFSPTHTLGAGAIVINENDELLVMRDNWSSYRGYKLPGGYLEQGEKIEEAVVREVLEETGVQTRFDAVLGLRSRYPVQLDKSNLYVVCRLIALSHEIVITDTSEVAEACWLPLEEYFADETVSSFNKKMVAELRHCEGLKATPAEITFAPHAQHEVFFAKR